MRSSLTSITSVALSLVAVLALSCKGPGDAKRPTSRPSAEAGTASGVDARGSYDRFGAELAAGDTPIVPSSELIDGLASYEGKTVRVLGRVASTCPKKGCWMWVGHGADRVFVRFQDYAFFVPTQGAEGRRVVFEGVVSNKTMSVEEARHYAEDAGDIEGAKRITEARKVPFVMATAVRMYDAD